MANKSWIQPGPDYRYQIHELLRQYGHEALRADAGAWRMARDRHAGYYADFLEEQNRAMRGSGQNSAFAAAARPLCDGGTRLLAMKGRHPREELDALPDWIVVQAEEKLTVPGLQADRHLVIMSVIA